MIVQCKQCQTRFQLDESRVPLTGVRVRCSRCKESFFLPHASASQPEQIHGIAESAALSGELPTPEPARDLAAESELAEPAVFDAGDSPLAQPDDASAQSHESVEETIGPVLGGISEEEDWRFDDEVPEEEADSADSVAEGIDVESAFGSVDDFSSLIEEVSDADGAELESAAELESLEAPAPSVASVEIGRISAPQGRPGPSALADRPAESGSGAQDHELGDPEDWNFFSDASSSDYQPPPAATTNSDSVAAAADPLLGAEAGTQSETRAVSEEGSRLGLVGGSRWASFSPAARVGHALGWLAVVSLLAAGLFQGLLLEEVQARDPVAYEVGELVVDRMIPSWIDNQYRGRMLAVRGRILNATSEVVVQEQTILVSLVDELGNALPQPPALAAISLSDEAIRELPMPELRRAQARAASALAAAVLAPGESLSFTVLFESVPDEAKAFALETGPAWPPAEKPFEEPPAVPAPKAPPFG